MMERVLEILTGAGLEAAEAAGHVGVCARPYCVVRAGGARAGKSIMERHILVTALAPARLPGALEAEMDAVRAALTAAGFAFCSAGAVSVLEDYRAVCAEMDFLALCAME